MNLPEKLLPLIDQFYVECAEDYVGLWMLVGDVRRAIPDGNSAQVMSYTIEILDGLLTSKKIVAGNFSEDKEFCQWKNSTIDTLERIREEWVALGRDPTIGEIVWFTVIE